MQVREIMSTNAVTVSPEDSAEKAARLLSRYNIGALPVTAADGRLRGIVTDRDIVLRCVAAESNAGETRIKEIMTRRVITAAPQDDARSAAQLMARERVRRLPVVESGKLVGMLSLCDMARTGEYSMEASRALSEISENIKRR